MNQFFSPEFFPLCMSSFNNFSGLKETNLNIFLTSVACIFEADLVSNPQGFCRIPFSHLTPCISQEKRTALQRGYGSVRRLAGQFNIFVILNSLKTKIVKDQVTHKWRSILAVEYVFLLPLLSEYLKLYFIPLFSQGMQKGPY